MLSDLRCIEGTKIYYPESSAIRSCVLSKDDVIQGIFFSAGSIIGFNESGRLWRCNISKKTTINNIPCKAKTEVEFLPEGNLLSCTLSDDTEINSINAMADTLLMFHPNGNLFKCNIRNELDISGFVLAPLSDVCFFDDRRLSAFTLYRNEVIKGIPCSAGTRVWLHKNGSVKGCTLSHDFELNGVVHKRGSFIVFDEQGQLISVCS